MVNSEEEKDSYHPDGRTGRIFSDKVRWTLRELERLVRSEEPG